MQSHFCFGEIDHRDAGKYSRNEESEFKAERLNVNSGCYREITATNMRFVNKEMC